VYSVDDTFLPTGAASGIEWQQDFDYYLQLLTEGLQKKKPSILEVFRVWDQKFYPNSEDGLAGGVGSDDEGEEGRRAALEEMNAEEPEEEDGNNEEEPEGRGSAEEEAGRREPEEDNGRHEEEEG
jgi:hypothetical protein